MSFSLATRCAVSLIAASASKKASKVPERLRRQNRFQMLFQRPNSSGRARQSDVLKHEILQGFEKLPVVPSVAAAP